MMWSEERIRELMSAARLREVNWDKQTPAERFFKNENDVSIRGCSYIT